LSYGRERLLDTPEGTEYYNWVDTNQPNGRSGTNEEVGQLCLFLASDAASYITGINMIISSGAELGYGIKYPLRFAK
jgi:NAD(P)-dependent dehydrogenase (short-subunit alcohol dehydrogenase family)